MSKDLAQYIREVADPVFSKWIRLQYSHGGYCYCVTCGKRVHWKHIDCGHFMPRSNMATRFYFENCAPQCVECNRFELGKPLEFEEYLMNQYGEDIVTILNKKAKTIKKYTTYELVRKVIGWRKDIKEWERGQ